MGDNAQIAAAARAIHDAAQSGVSWDSLGKASISFVRNMARAALVAGEAAAPPIDMLLWCPTCHAQHVDKPDARTPEWSNPPHKSHLCHTCGTIWRPSNVPTNGVRTIAMRGKADTWPRLPPPPPGDKGSAA